VTKVISITFIDLVTPKARAKHELLFNKPASVALDETNLKKMSVRNTPAYFGSLSVTQTKKVL
jgi:hypothetical protein